METIEDDMDITMNYANAQEHVPEIERSNRVIKERVRAQYHLLQFKNILKS